MATKSKSSKAAAKKSSAKASSKKTPATPKKKGRGRPKLYTGKKLTHIQTLIKKNGASGAMAILQADDRIESYVEDPGAEYLAEQTALIAQRSTHLFPVDGSCKITMPTLLSIAKDAGIVLQRGRRTVKKAA